MDSLRWYIWVHSLAKSQMLQDQRPCRQGVLFISVGIKRGWAKDFFGCKSKVRFRIVLRLWR